jgi:hypothetical protein
VYRDWRRGEHEREWAVLTLLASHVPGLSPYPLRGCLDEDPPWIEMTLVPGTPLGGQLDASQMRALIESLRALWSVPVETLPLRRFACPEALAVARNDFHSVRRPDGVAGAAFDACVTFLARPNLVPDAAPAVLGHSDPNLANYLWDGSRLRIVDFEDAGRSDVAYELATLIEQMSARDTDWRPLIEAFDVDATRVPAAGRPHRSGSRGSCPAGRPSIGILRERWSARSNTYLR